MPESCLIRHLGRAPYLEVWQKMKDFTDSRSEDTPDEIWLVEHHAVFTQGQAGKPEHLLNVSDIPVVQSDRGGQVTYHGPGQLVLYLMLELRRHKLGVRDLVTLIEESVIELLDQYDVIGLARRDAPGVYVDDRKVAALGLRVRKGRSYHGLSLNVAMDLSPFSQINPCGYSGLEVTDTTSLGIQADMQELGEGLTSILWRRIGYHGAPATITDQAI
ncbi:MAG: lipoyl(octanoyl) transferase LipB [Pseudomonadales bacterium]|nr:lipoyl(octanoyl) transferase LipB [Pseudomonadales bacterium]MBO6597546.1 lipoyl(octanoyl) transferase LipB [Pseudomonadales bacterium]MBO6824404.1 lipoyl(octanoyl) transferase LipB [Pseudomonadales bacterium]